MGAARRVIGLLVVVASAALGCGGGSSGGHDGPSSPTPNITTLTLIDDTSRHHLGTTFRSDFVIKSPEGREKSYSFGLSGKPVSGTVQITVFDMDLLGADVVVNGAVVIAMPPPFNNGSRSADIPVVNLLVGQNTLIVRARGSGSQVEDFEYQDLRVTVTIESPS